MKARYQMQIVIDIPDEKYDRLLYQDIISLRSYVENGTVLPKGHGRLIDVDEVIKIANKTKDLHGAIWNAPTIIKAESEAQS